MLSPEKELSCGIFDSSLMRKKQTKSNPREVSSYELEIFLSDGGVSYMNNEVKDVRRGMLLCAKPGAIRRSDFPVRCGYIRISADAAEREGLIPLLSALPSYTYAESSETADELIALFSKLERRLFASGEDPLTALRANALFLDILYRLHKTCGGGNKTQTSTTVGDPLHAAREYILEHFSEDCSLSRIAGEVNLSPNYLHTAFKEAFGETPYSYVTKKRIEKAKRLIAAGRQSMFDIALETGFCSGSHFTKVFRATTGMTPKEFRNSVVDKY